MSSLIVILFVLFTLLFELIVQHKWHKLPSDVYSDKGAYLVMERPKLFVQYVGCLLFGDSAGSVYYVLNGTAYCYMHCSEKQKRIKFHLKPDHKIKKVDKVHLSDKPFSILKGNCKTIYYDTTTEN